MWLGSLKALAVFSLLNPFGDKGCVFLFFN